MSSSPQDSEIPDSTSGPQRSLQTQDSEIPDSNSGHQRSLQTQDSESPDFTSGPQRSLQTQDSEIPNSISGPQCFLQTRYTLANSQIPKSNPGPKAPKAKRFRIPRVQRLKLHFPPCNHAQPPLRTFHADQITAVYRTLTSTHGPVSRSLEHFRPSTHLEGKNRIVIDIEYLYQTARLDRRPTEN